MPQDQPRTTHRQPLGAARGATLAEAAIVVAVAGALAAIAAPSLESLVLARRLDATASRLAADIQFARAEAVARQAPLRLSIPAGAGCWVIHPGDAATGCTPAGALKSGVLDASERVGVVANVGSVLFDPLFGTATPTATLRVADARGREVRHVINVLGRTRSCATDAALFAYRRC